MTKELEYYIDPTIEVGDKVRMIDGSGLSIANSSEEVYVVDSYPELLGTDRLLKNLIATVIAVGVETNGINGYKTIYIQDIQIQIGEVVFNTCSQFVSKVEDMKTGMVRDTTSITNRVPIEKPKRKKRWEPERKFHK